MEDEAFFLFVVCRAEPLEPIIREGKEFRDFVPVIRRVSMQKPERPRGDLIYKRINVDFDPLEEHQGYVVVIHASRLVERATVADQFHFPAITLTEQEAKVVKERIDVGGYRNYLKKGEKFVKCEVLIAVITKI